MANVVILGATSAIAQQTARFFAKAGDSLFLVGRSRNRLEIVAQDLVARGAGKAVTHMADLSNPNTHAPLLSQIKSELKSIDVLLIAYGMLPDQKFCEQSMEATREAVEANFTSVVSILTLFANELSNQKSGTIAVLSSVAGDRGRKSNYVYGACKGGLGLFLQGLRNRLYAEGVHVLTVKPGFVDTPMTAHLKKNFLFASPEKVGKKIYRAIRSGKNVVYVPCFWRWIMFVIRAIPEAVFKRLSF